MVNSKKRRRGSTNWNMLAILFMLVLVGQFYVVRHYQIAEQQAEDKLHQDSKQLSSLRSKIVSEEKELRKTVNRSEQWEKKWRDEKNLESKMKNDKKAAVTAAQDMSRMEALQAKEQVIAKSSKLQKAEKLIQRLTANVNELDKASEKQTAKIDSLEKNSKLQHRATQVLLRQRDHKEKIRLGAGANASLGAAAVNAPQFVVDAPLSAFLNENEENNQERQKVLIYRLLCTYLQRAA
jgi:hypothetical protein